MTINPNITIMMQYAYFGSAVQEREREKISQQEEMYRVQTYCKEKEQKEGDQHIIQQTVCNTGNSTYNIGPPF
jgi:hypothetical protein